MSPEERKNAIYSGHLRLCQQPRAAHALYSDQKEGKYLSTSFIRAQSLCLINRQSFLGEGAQAAARRRSVAKQLEEGRRRERQAHYLAHIRGRGLSHEGQIFI
jgi:hypothetical protein